MVRRRHVVLLTRRSRNIVLLVTCCVVVCFLRLRYDPPGMDDLKKQTGQSLIFLTVSIGTSSANRATPLDPSSVDEETGKEAYPRNPS